MCLVLLLTPVVGPITQDCSFRHPAVDYACISGAPVTATHPGYLTKDFDPDMGHVALLKGETYTSSYSHLSVVMAPGWYEAGDTIGTCGSTGRLSTGPHVHYTIATN